MRMDKLPLNDQLANMLMKQSDIYQKCINECERCIEKLPSGKIRVQKSGKYCSFYQRSDSKDGNGTYIGKHQLDLAHKLIQKEYLIDVVDELKRELDILKRCSNEYHPERLAELYDELDCVRKAVVQPVVVTDEEFARRWSEVTYAPSSFDEGAPEHYTDKNERVRSKSEIMIANALNMNNVPYRYEYPLKLKDGRIVRPDFLCLNVRTREEFYWEHLGMMSDLEYVANSVRKINAYASEDIVQGKNLLLTYETQFQPLDTRVVKKMIWEFLK